MNEIIHTQLGENENHYHQDPDDLRTLSISSSRTYSISPEHSIRHVEDEQVTRGSFVTYRENPPQFHPLLDEGAITNDAQSLTTQEERCDDSSVKTVQARQPKCRHTWRLEIGAVMLSLCAMVTLVVLLIHADDQPLEEWRFFISFNALISILGAVARAPLGFVMGSCLGQAKWNWFKKRPGNLSAFERFEDASRGPMGSLWLLSWLHVRHWSTLGALVTVVLLGFEPFLQAIVDYTGQLDISQLLPSPTVRISSSLDAGSYSDPYKSIRLLFPAEPTEDIDLTDPSIRIPDVGMTAALIDGLNNATKQTDSATPFFYPSGNCTWTPYTTLATCSICNDVTASLTILTTYGENLGTLNVENGQISDNYTRYALPYVSLANGDNSTMTPAYMAAAAVSNSGRTASFQNLNTLIAAVGIIRAPSSYNKTNWPEYPPRATECALYWCTKAYIARVENGIFNESLIGNWSDRDPQSYAAMPYDDTGLTESQLAELMVTLDTWNNHSLVSNIIGLPRFDLQLRISDQQALGKALPEDALRVFNISQSSIETASYAIYGQLFSGEQLVWPLSQNGGDRYLYSFTAQAIGTTQTQDYDAIFGNMAQRMTDYMRRYSDTAHVGEQQEWVIHVRVRWAYLVLPLLVIVGACLVLILTIVETKYRRLEPWKSDVLATFTHSVDAEIQKQLRIAELDGQAKYTAQRTIVSLVDTGDFVELKVKKD